MKQILCGLAIIVLTPHFLNVQKANFLKMIGFHVENKRFAVRREKTKTMVGHKKVFSACNAHVVFLTSAVSCSNEVN